MKSSYAWRARAVASLSYISFFASSFTSALVFITLISAHTTSAAVSGTIDTYVGGGNGDGDAAVNAAIDPRGLVAIGSASSPDLYIVDGKSNRVRRVDGDTGIIETVAGDGVAAFDGDNGDARNASLSFPLDVAVDGSGNVYIADQNNNRIRKVTTDHRIVTIAGNGNGGYSGEGPAVQESLFTPAGVAVGPDGNIYIADLQNNRIRRVSPPGCSPATCVIDTVVGNGSRTFSGDGGPALQAGITKPSDVAFDSAGNMLICDRGNNRIRRVVNGVITTIAGGGSYGPNGEVGDGGPATSAVLYTPSQVSADANGNVYIADTNHHRIRLLRPNGSTFTITTVAGTGATGWAGDGGPATSATLFNVWGVAVTSPGTFWLAQSAEVAVSPNNRVRKVTSFGNIQTVVGGGDGDGGSAINAQVDPRGGEAVDTAGAMPDLYFADGSYNLVRHVDGDTGIIDTIAGTGAYNYTGDGGTAANATFRTPSDVAVDSVNGIVYVADAFNNVIRRIESGRISTFAGNGQAGFNGDGPSPNQKALNAPRGIDVDNFGNLFIADTENHRIRKVSGGQITTVAGNGSSGFATDNVAATSTPLKLPCDVVVADDGTLYIADADANRIYRVTPSGILRFFAGTGTQGYSGDGVQALTAQLYGPAYLALDGNGYLYFADSGNNRVRRVSSGGVIELIAGNGLLTTSGDGGSASAAGLGSPSGVAVDKSGGEVFISVKDADRVRMVEIGGAAQPSATPSFTATSIPPSNTPTRTPIQPTATNTLNPTKTPTAVAASVNLSGEVTYYANAAVRVPNVQVALSGPLPQTVLTNGSGAYSALNMPTGNWEIQPGKVGAIGSAVSSLDAAWVLQYIAGSRTLSSLQQLAGDVTGDGTISVLDATNILKLSAGVIDRLPAGQSCNSDWLFYPRPDPTQNQLVVTPLMSSGSCRQGNIELNPMLTTASHQDFEAILLGDCTGNWTQSIGGAFRLTAGGGITVNAGSLRRTAGSRLRLPIYVQSPAPFQAMDLKIGYDDSKLQFRSVLTHGAAIGALTGVNNDVPGVVAFSMASAEQIDSNGAILIVEFTSAAADAADAAVRLLSAQVDEQSAKVVTHSDND